MLKTADSISLSLSMMINEKWNRLPPFNISELREYIFLKKYQTYRCNPYSPVPVQFDWDKIRTEMKPIKMARTKA